MSFWRMRDRLVEGEHHLLKTLGFTIKPELPFAYLLNYLKALSAPGNVACFGKDTPLPRPCLITAFNAPSGAPAMLRSSTRLI